jgi:hypothetical protein
MHDIPDLSVVRRTKISHRVMFLRSSQQDFRRSFNAAVRYIFSLEQGNLLGLFNLLTEPIGKLRYFVWTHPVLSSAGISFVPVAIISRPSLCKWSSQQQQSF